MIARVPTDPAPRPTPADLAAHRQHCRAMREVNRRLVDALPRRALDLMGDRLGLREGERFVFPAEHWVDVLADACLYDWIEEGQSLVQRFAAGPGADAGSRSERRRTRACLDAMLQARYVVFRIEQVDPGVGVRVRDLATGDARYVVDRSLATQGGDAGWCVASRLLPFGRWWVTTGAAVTLGRLGPEEVREIRRTFEGAPADQREGRLDLIRLAILAESAAA